MSYAIPTTSLSGATTSTTGTVNWTNLAQSLGYPGPGDMPHLALYNESPCELQITFNTGEQIILPAGGWQTVTLNAQSTSFSFVVLAILNASPIVASLFGIWYAPGEPVPTTPTLGNSPIGAAVATSPFANALQGLNQARAVTEVDLSGPNAGPGLRPTNLGDALHLLSGSNNEGLRIDAAGNVTLFFNVEVFGSTTLDTTLAVTGVTTLTGGLAQLTKYNGDTLAGNGLTSIVKEVDNQSVTTTVSQTVFSLTTPNDGNPHTYRVTIFFVLNNAVSGNNIQAQVFYTNMNSVARNINNLVEMNGTAALTVANGATSLANGDYTGMPITVTCKPNSVLSGSFRDPTNTPNDLVTYVVERLS